MPGICERGGEMFSKEEIERIKRETGLPELAASYGYAMDEKASCRTSLVMRHHGNKKSLWRPARMDMASFLTCMAARAAA